jgi:DNA-directed RNA polymerase specialized sigma24 family protein
MSPQAGFVLQDQIVPRLKAVIPRTVLCVGSEDHEELVQDATCLAARIMDQAEANGKTVTASSVSYYSIQHCKSGRRAVGHSSSDVHGSACQLQGRVRVESLEEVVAVNEENGGEIFELHDVLGSDEEDPGTKAARKMDWETFMAGLSAREQALIECLVDGRSLRDAAKSFRLSDSSIQGTKRKLAVKIQEFMGFDILVQIRRQPQWKQDIEATREKMACKYDRLH